MCEIFGNFMEMGETQEYLIISFSSNTLPVRECWRNNGLSANFLAEYWGTFFPVSNTLSQNRQLEIRDAVSYIANELLENAVKFSHEISKHTIKVGLYLSHNEIRFYVTNSINPQTVGQFQHFIRELLTGDTDELYIRQLEKNADDETDSESRLGFLTILNDYDALLAWKFETIQQYPRILLITTMVQLDIVRI